MKILLTLFVLLFSSSVVAEYGDTYLCNTIQISEMTEKGVNSNFESIAFQFLMQKPLPDSELGSVFFDDTANTTIVNTEGFGFLLMETHKSEQFMASFGMTKAWFLNDTLSISSVYHEDENVAIKIVTSISKCDKF